jgi:tRNA-specific 2-thiouridylase
VAGKDAARNALIVVQHQDHPLLLSDAFDVEQLHWLDAAAEQDLECAVKTRYRQSDLPCTLLPRTHGAAGAAIRRVVLREPARAVTPGQYAVFYRGAQCLGGGVIAQRYNSGITYTRQLSVEGS